MIMKLIRRNWLLIVMAVWFIFILTQTKWSK